ncbi:MAG: sulfite exporter TauE/SafE family protein [Burkholderiaceae bacterium]
MFDMTTGLVVSLAVFAGAFVSGLAGFAFSAVAGAVLLHVFPAQEAVPLMMVCSVVIQMINLWGLRKSIHWVGSIPLIAGGLLGVPIAVHLLQTADTRFLRLGFGLIVTLYAGYMLFRPGLAKLGEQAAGKYTTALIGFGGGLVGGLTAMPGAVPTIWCDMRGMSKGGQRGLVQPFIASTQIFAVALLLGQHSFSRKIAVDLAVSVPAMLAGVGLGLLAFRHVNEQAFRKIILVMLFLSGGALVFA